MAHDAGYYPLDVAILSGDASLVELILAQPGISHNSGALEATGFNPKDRTKMLASDCFGNSALIKYSRLFRVLLRCTMPVVSGNVRGYETSVDSMLFV